MEKQCLSPLLISKQIVGVEEQMLYLMIRFLLALFLESLGDILLHYLLGLKNYIQALKNSLSY